MTPNAGNQYGAALRYGIQELGGLLNEQDSNPTIQTSATIVASGNGERVGLIIVNLGANPMFISLTPDVSSTNGINLPPAGGSVSMNVRDDFTLASRQWWGICTGGTSAAFVIELLRIDTSGLEQPK